MAFFAFVGFVSLIGFAALGLWVVIDSLNEWMVMKELERIKKRNIF